MPTTDPVEAGACATFDDLKTWWFASDGHTPASHGRYQVGWTGVNVPKTGTTIRVKNQFTNKIAKIGGRRRRLRSSDGVDTRSEIEGRLRPPLVVQRGETGPHVLLRGRSSFFVRICAAGKDSH